MDNKQLYYFGCINVVGHYMHPYASLSNLPGVNKSLLDHIDGTFTPGWSTKQGAAQFVQVGKISIIAWHDYSVDKRPGSNSNIICYGYSGDEKQIIEEMFKDFKVKFPAVVQRQPCAITFEDGTSLT